MQAVYHARYLQIRDVQRNFIRLDHVRQRMVEFDSMLACHK
jgi:hypothetical protein